MCIAIFRKLFNFSSVFSFYYYLLYHLPFFQLTILAAIICSQFIFFFVQLFCVYHKSTKSVYCNFLVILNLKSPWIYYQICILKEISAFFLFLFFHKTTRRSRKSPSQSIIPFGVDPQSRGNPKPAINLISWPNWAWLQLSSGDLDQTFIKSPFHFRRRQRKKGEESEDEEERNNSERRGGAEYLAGPNQLSLQFAKCVIHQSMSP